MSSKSLPFVAAILPALLAQACYKPVYRAAPSTSRHGYSEVQQPDKSYAITYQGRFDDARDVVEALWHKRANELCGGDRQYLFRDLELTSKQIEFGVTWQANGTIRCHVPPE